MLPRPVITCLVLSLPILLVSAAVASGGYLAVDAAGDHMGAATLRWCLVALLMLTAVDVILLAAALGIQALQRGAPDEHESEI